MSRSDGVGRKKKWLRKVILLTALILLVAAPIRCLHPACRRVALRDISWTTLPVEIEIFFDDQEPILIPSGEYYFSLRARLQPIFARNQDLLHETPLREDFRVVFTYEFRVWFILCYPSVQDWGGTATFYADGSLRGQVMRVLRDFDFDF